MVTVQFGPTPSPDTHTALPSGIRVAGVMPWIERLSKGRLVISLASVVPKNPSGSWNFGAAGKCRARCVIKPSISSTKSVTTWV